MAGGAAFTDGEMSASYSHAGFTRMVPAALGLAQAKHSAAHASAVPRKRPQFDPVVELERPSTADRGSGHDRCVPTADGDGHRQHAGHHGADRVDVPIQLISVSRGGYPVDANRRCRMLRCPVRAGPQESTRSACFHVSPGAVEAAPSPTSRARRVMSSKVSNSSSVSAVLSTMRLEMSGP